MRIRLSLKYRVRICGSTYRHAHTAVTLLTFASILACHTEPSEPSGPEEVRVLTSWVTESVAPRVTPAGQFIRSTIKARYLSQVAAESVAIAVARSMVPGGAYENSGLGIQQTRGARVNFAQLLACGRTDYIDVATDDLPPNIPGPARRAYGPQWGVTLCAPQSSAAQVSVGVPDGPRDFRVERNELVLSSFRTTGGGADWTVVAVPAEFPSGMVVTAEAAAEAVFRATARRVSEVPSAFAMIDDIRSPGIPVPACAAWRVTVESPVRVRGIESGAEREMRTFFVKQDSEGCARGSIALFAASPRQPPGRSIVFLRDTTGAAANQADPFDTVLVPVNGLGHFERVEVIR